VDSNHRSPPCQGGVLSRWTTGSLEMYGGLVSRSGSHSHPENSPWRSQPRTKAHRTRNLAAQEITSSGGYQGHFLERFQRTRTRGMGRSKRTPRSTQAGSVLPVAAGLRPIQESCGTGAVSGRQPGEGEAVVAAASLIVNNRRFQVRHFW
jgi:hypothetical protein